MIKLTVCFETRYEGVHTLKSNRYADFMGQIADSSVDGTLVMLEVGSCGFLSLPNFNIIKQQLLECSEAVGGFPGKCGSNCNPRFPQDVGNQKLD